MSFSFSERCEVITGIAFNAINSFLGQDKMTNLFVYLSERMRFYES
jgi:hypothetical protein